MITYLTQKNTNKAWIVDIETDSLKPTVIWVCVVKNLDTEEELVFKSKEEFNRWYSKDFVLIGHNALSFDIPNLNRLWNAGIDFDSVIDSLVLSFLYNPALFDGHSLEAWGRRLSFPKTDFNEWDRYSPEMERYCKNDVQLTLKLYLALTEKMRKIGYSNLSCYIEHRIRTIIDQQEQNGFYFNRAGATDLLKYLRQLQCDLAEDIHRIFPPVSTVIKTVSFRRTSDGRLPVRIEKARQRYARVDVDEERGQYTCIDDIPFNIGSPKQRVQRLQELGWQPTAFTEKGFPKVDEDALVRFAEESGRKEISAIAEWLVLQGRSSMIETWLKNLGEDSRIHGRILTCGASSRRGVHSAPNSANIPSPAKAKYGKEVRELWTVEPNKELVLVGVDASGLENVGLLHYLSDKHRKKAEETLNQKKPNDIHSLNARKLTEVVGKEVDREWGAKTSYYASMYGAYPPKIAQILKCDVSLGEKAQKALFNSVPGLTELIEEVQGEFDDRNGRLRCIDGGYVVCPSRSASLNYRIQSLGAVVMKLACILYHDEAQKQGIWFRQVGWIHDEFQIECKKEDADRLGKIVVQSIEEAAKQLKFKVPLTGEYKVGSTWASTH